MLVYADDRSKTEYPPRATEANAFAEWSREQIGNGEGSRHGNVEFILYQATISE